MPASTLPAVMAFFALGLCLALARPRLRSGAVALAVVSAAVTYRYPFPGIQTAGIHLLCWGFTVVAAACVYLRQGPNWAASVALGLALGSMAGAVSGRANAPLQLILAATGSLVMFPAAWLIRRGLTMAVRVVASWLIAIACLSAAIALVPTPGYEADHME